MAEPCLRHAMRGSSKLRAKFLPLTLTLSPRKAGRGTRCVMAFARVPSNRTVHGHARYLMIRHMHVLARGDLLQRLRLISGLMLFTFAATHFLNHALGLVSLDAMQAMQAWRKVVTRSWIGSGVLLAAFLTHFPQMSIAVMRELAGRLERTNAQLAAQSEA